VRRCSMLQCVAMDVAASVLQSVAVCCRYDLLICIT